VIALLAIGLVLATMVGVAVLAHEVFGLPWASAFGLGAILGPTDAIAATAILRRLGVPRRIATILEGEALVNDAIALVADKIAIAAAVGEGFSASHTRLEFLGVAVSGIAIGLLVGYLLAEIRERLDDPATERRCLSSVAMRRSSRPTSSASPVSWRRSPEAPTSTTARPNRRDRRPGCAPRPSGSSSPSSSTRRSSC
jgi:NhaP-type Na+/H+ or K+/H+ antiporter